MAVSKLTTQCISVPDKIILVMCFRHEQLVGHAFASVWDFELGEPTCYLTHLFIEHLYFLRCCRMDHPTHRR